MSAEIERARKSIKEYRKGYGQTQLPTDCIIQLMMGHHKAELEKVGAEKLAEYFHNNYEEIALNNGWKTQDDCQVPFKDLPKENKSTMIEVCERVLQKLKNKI